MVPEVALLRRGSAYPQAAEGFATGTEEGVGAWVVFCAKSITDGAKEAGSIADAAGAGQPA